MKLTIKLLTAAVLIFGTAGVFAYPDRPIQLIIPFAAGGPTDTVGRALAQSMGTDLKQPLVAVNVGGAGGTTGSARVAQANPDGYTLLLMHIGMSTAPSLYKKMSFDPLKDFEYIGLVVDVPMTLLGKKDLPANNFAELQTYIKQNAAKLNYAHAGIGSASHLCGMLFMSALQTDLTTVPYQGTGPAMTALMGGQVDLMCDQTTNTTAQIKAGTVKVYGVTSQQRVATLPNVPTLNESGLRGFQVGVWHGLYAPKGTPKAVVDRLVQSLQNSLKDAVFVKRMEDLGARIYDTKDATPQGLKATLESEINKWSPVIKKAGVFAD